MDGKKEFVGEFKEFVEQLSETGIEISTENAVNLFAIFRKDLRTERINGNEFREQAEQDADSTWEGPQATERQKRFLKRLADERDIEISDEELDGMSKQEASKRITDLLGGE